LLEKTAYLLVYHGSRDPRPQQEMYLLAQEVRQALVEQSVVSSQERERTAVLTKPPQPLVYTAALELAPLSLEAAIAQVITQLKSQGVTHLQVIPLFLLPGVHVREDIPSAVEKAREATENQVTITLTPYLGQSPSMAQQLQSSFSDGDNSAKIIVSHGSRRPGGNQPIVNLAQQLGIASAYWSVSPTLTEQVEALVKQGKEKIEVIPYFLFPGGITDAIAQQVQSLQTQFPQVYFWVGDPLRRRISLADLIINEIIV
jgi:sirohydrochlorin ferrochelatase